MNQRSPANSASTAAPIPAVDVVDIWSGPARPHWLDLARQAIALPTTWRGFTLFLLVLLLIAAATAMEVYLSAQILETEVQIDALRAELDGVERVNAEVAWQIAVLSRMENITARARALGFEPVAEPIYVPRDQATPSAAAITPPQPFYADSSETDVVYDAAVARESWLVSANEAARSGLERARQWSAEEMERQLSVVQDWLGNR